jgi:hypothetical protein
MHQGDKGILNRDKESDWQWVTWQYRVLECPHSAWDYKTVCTTLLTSSMYVLLRYNRVFHPRSLPLTLGYLPIRHSQEI